MKSDDLDLYWMDKNTHLSWTRCIYTTRAFHEGIAPLSRAFDLCAFQIEPLDAFSDILVRKLYAPDPPKVLQSHVYEVGLLPSSVAAGQFVQSIVEDRIKHVEAYCGFVSLMHLDAEAGLSRLGLNDKKFRIVCFVASLFDDKEEDVTRTRVILASQFILMLGGHFDHRETIYQAESGKRLLATTVNSSDEGQGLKFPRSK